MKYILLIAASLIILPTYANSGLLLNSRTDIYSVLSGSLDSASISVGICVNEVSSPKLLKAVKSLASRGVDVTLITLKKPLYENLRLSDSLLGSGCEILFLDDIRDLPEIIVIDNESAYFGGWSLGSSSNSIWSYSYYSDETDEVSSASLLLKQIAATCSKYESIKDTLQYEKLMSDPEKYRDLWLTVKGTAVDVYSSKNGKTYFIKFSKAKGAMTTVLFSDVIKDLKSSNIVPLYFLNKKIAVSGKFIKHEKYGWEIILESGSDISAEE